MHKNTALSILSLIFYHSDECNSKYKVGWMHEPRGLNEITHQRLNTLESILDSIDGIGNYKKNNLLKHFGSVAKIKTASIKSISRVNGIGLHTAEIIYKKFNNTDG